MLDNDIPGLDESRLRGAGTRDAGPARACAVESSGLDEPGTSVGLTREAAAPSGETFGNLGTGLQNPDQSISRAMASTCIGQLLIGMKELCRDSGLDETVTAEMVGQVARDLSDKNGGDFPI